MTTAALPLPLTPSVPALELRPYQRNAAQAFRAGARHGLRRMVVQMATGLGKTVLFADLAHEAVRLGGRVLVIAHRDELLRQARDKLLLADPTAEVGIVRAEHDESDAAIVVASIQTLARPERLARIGRFSLIVIDEAHHAAAPSYRQILDALGAFAPVGPLVLGVTATPGRGDGVGLDSVFQEIVYSMTILDGIRGGYLCDLRAVSVTLDTDFSAGIWSTVSWGTRCSRRMRRSTSPRPTASTRTAGGRSCSPRRSPWPSGWRRR